MKRAYVAALIALIVAAVIVIAIRSRGKGTPPPLFAASVMVHCPNGGTLAFVTPERVTIKVGDAVEWRTTGETPADSIWIVAKDPAHKWPFAGALPAGRVSANTGKANVKDSLQYAVKLRCQIQGASQPVTIDPDIIIQEQ